MWSGVSKIFFMVSICFVKFKCNFMDIGYYEIIKLFLHDKNNLEKQKTLLNEPIEIKPL